MKPYLLIVGLCALLFPLSGVAGNSSGEPVEVPEIIHLRATVGDVTFPHEMHVADFGAECADCHHPTNGAPLTMPHQSYFRDFWIDCKECHLEEVRAEQIYDCSKCHPRGHKGATNETLSAKAFVHRACWECHEVGVGVEASESCSTCHEKSSSGNTGAGPAAH